MAKGSTTSTPRFADVVFPLEMHIFQREERFYAFDARSFAVLQLNAHSAAVLGLMASFPLGDIVQQLADTMSESEVKSIYVGFLQLIRDGALSVAPLERPQRPPFNRLVLMLAGGCNMGCSYCFEKDVPIYQKPNIMTLERADEVLDWFFRHQEGDRAHVQLYGGEPLLNWNILVHVVNRMEDWAGEKGVELTKYLITNGTLLNATKIEYLKQHNVTVQVSVDGDADTHNRFRVFKSGKATMEYIKPNIVELERQEAHYNLRAVLTKQNKKPQSVIDGLRSLGARRVSFEVVATDNADAQFTDPDWNEFNEEYLTFVNEPYAAWASLPDEMQTMIIRICEQQKVFYGCGAGISEVTVSPDGSIYECQRIYREPYSKIGDDRSPTELDSQLLTMVDDRRICRDCWARYLCGGGCMHQSHVGHGCDDPLPQFCEMKRNLAEASITKIVEIREASAKQQEKEGVLA